MNKVIGVYDKFDHLVQGDPGFLWDEVLVLCEYHAPDDRRDTEVLGETNEPCLYCRP